MRSTTSTTRSRAADISPLIEPDLTDLRQQLGYEFQEPGLLRRALAHRSWCAEVGGEASNERLEFLGDAVLGWAVADLSYRRHADLPEGKLTDLRKSVVNASALADLASDIGLGAALLLGKGEDAAGGRSKASILSDALEAVIGAVYLDGGPGAAFALIERLFAGRMADAALRLDRLDHKTVLQELTARLFDSAPVYVISDSGPDHDKRFFATVIVEGEAVGKGEGRSKKTAEQAAAEAAWTVLVVGHPVG
ncbi:MAG: ribonuclease III [Actinomycetota bacterium]